jgi:predicted naringenin-chalcone synthase
MDPLASRLRPDPRDVGQQLRARIAKEIESVGPDLRRHAAWAIGCPAATAEARKRVAAHRARPNQRECLVAGSCA